MPRRSGPYRPTRPTRSVCVVLFVLSLGGLLLGASRASAQRARGVFTLGPQVGQPAGVTGKLYRSAHTAYEGLVTTDGDDVLSVYFHRLQERPLPDSLLHLYAGPGLFVEGTSLDDAPTVGLGTSAQVGLNFYAERFEVFLHATPVARILPDVELSVGGSVGLRYLIRSP